MKNGNCVFYKPQAVSTTTNCKRSGVVLIAVLACCVVCIGILGASLRQSTSARRELRVHLQREQTRLLLHTGLELVRNQPQEFNAAEKLILDVSGRYEDFSRATMTIEVLPAVDKSAGKSAESLVRITAYMSSRGAQPHNTKLSSLIKLALSASEETDRQRVSTSDSSS